MLVDFELLPIVVSGLACDQYSERIVAVVCFTAFVFRCAELVSKE